MSFETDSEDDTILEEQKNIIFTICSNFLENRLEELYVKGSFNNTDLLLLVDEIMDSLLSLILNQVKRLPPIKGNCFGLAIENFTDSWERSLEKIANKITRTQIAEKTIFQTFNQIDKTQKSLVNGLFFSFKKCLNSKV